MNVLVTGGAGYIGSHACKELKRSGHVPVVVDNLIYGHEWAVQWGPFYKLDIRETNSLVAILEKEKIEAVMHFAAFAYVGESVKEPLKYYDNNYGGTLSLLSAMKKSKVRKIVFSSTCATYGEPKVFPISEDTTQAPINPYGRSKLMVEQTLKDLAQVNEIEAIALRYFNAAGADSELEIGEDHNPETHVIPLAIEAAFQKNKSFTIYGDDYSTPDGTCIRDYIHVSDLATAHVLALKNLTSSTKSTGMMKAYNIGTGTGYSVQQIVRELEKITHKKIVVKKGSRRDGDPAQLLADPSRIRKELMWEPKHSSLKNILETAAHWYEKHTLSNKSPRADK
ncbi:MAG: UDP-glucose 4-epimerase GalE [Bdellovibrionales bacterium]